MQESVSKEPIAIIGMGCVLPDAPEVTTFWENLLAGRSSIREVPKERWDPDLFWNPDKSAPDKTYAKIGAFVANDAFNPIDFRMPPGTIAQIDPSQRWALAATRQAFKDAGYRTGLKGDEAPGPRGPPRDFDRTRCAVILGNAMGGEQMKLQAKTLYWPQVEQALRQDADFQGLPMASQDAILGRTKAAYQSGVPPITEDSMPGTLSNVAAGRIANVFDLSGKNFTTDAACASSLAALDSAIDSLRRGESDYVVWGGTDRSMDITPYVEFSKIGALSPDGSRPFDKDANGFVMGEGCVVFLLKRLTDAERDGDRIHAVIRGVGGSSDGKGKGITAPNPAGQVKAVLRAYQESGLDPMTVGYMEAHGTSTPVGDPVELAAAEEAFKALSKQPTAPGSILVGSVKSNMGHLKSAAGAVGMLKAVLATRDGLVPPSINVRTLNPQIDWANSPFKVPTSATPWPRPASHPRRAAVSSFGFGGTNFHVVIEEHIPGHLKVQAAGPYSQKTTAARPDPAATVTPPSSFPATGQTETDLPALVAHMATHRGLEAEPLVLDGAAAAQAAVALTSAKPSFVETGTGPRLRDILQPHTAAGLQAGTRVGLTVSNLDDVPKKLEQAQKAATNPAQARLAFNQGVFINKGAPQGKVAFLFPGQGTQYVNMFRDLAAKYEVVRNTFEEADRILLDELDGVRLTDILWPTPDTPEAQAASEKKLQLTEFTQPAVLAADVAMLRLMRQWGVEPHVVAGHSLGEYGALVAAGVLTFADALHAVAARGREMAHVEVPDLGKMASVSADWLAVSEALQGLGEYVIPANKNCPSQTVIAGSSKGVDEAVALLQAKGIQAQYLPVSAAFHSAIVAPASKPLRNVLSRLDVKAPKVRVLSNVGTEPYQDDVEWIRDNLATQVASPVEWIGIVERMYDEGVRTFIEVGPKLALTNFVRDILKARPDAVAIGSNHPKKGGLTHANELFAFLGAWGFRPQLPALDDPAVYTREFRDPAALFRRSAPSQATPAPGGPGPATLAEQVAHVANLVQQLQQQVAQSPVTPSVPASTSGSAQGIEQAVQAEVHRRLEAFGLTIDDVGVSGISVGLPGRNKPLFDDANWDRILAGENLIDTVPEAGRRGMVDKNIVRLAKSRDGSAQFQVVSDIAQVIQLAGQRGGFDVKQYGVDADLEDALDKTFQYAIAAGIEALRNAGIPLQRTYLQTSQGGYLPKEWKLPEALRGETGVIFASAFPGYDNLVRDVSRYLADKYAGRTHDELQSLYQELIGAVTDPEMRGRLQETFDREFQRLKAEAPDGTARYEFNRKFLFRVLSMGHSQLAQFIGARGPNTQVNAACASTTQALGIAEDWIRTGRARRVVVVGADDITNENLFEWFGSGFLAAGAATTKANVEDAALPFDRRRHGMIVGMGAVGMVVEAVPETEKRGMRPIAKLLATRVSNSAYHGSRLDVDHVASEMVAMMQTANRRYGVDAHRIAPQTLFMSHETYTPARGGSAAAEIHALRAAFGPLANKVVVANTKGFTGHPQGASIEDAIALKCLQRGQVPPIANLREPDPELGDLNLSKGGAYDIRYAVRLAAGFGSQVAMALFELAARENEQVADPARYDAWLAQVSGLPGARTEVANRTLRIVDQGPPARVARITAPIAAPAPMATPTPVPTATPTPTSPAAPASPPQTVAAPHPIPQGAAIPSSSPAQAAASSSNTSTPASAATVLNRLVDLVAEKTGYPKDLLDPNLDMEADLGIDTVKQAELFGAIRDAYALPQEDGIQIKDYPTLAKVAGYVTSRLGGSAAPTVPSTLPHAPPALQTATARAVAHATPHAEAISSQGLPLPPSHSIVGANDVLSRLVELVAEKTGYPKDLLDPNLDMEADLGIDTVKQAELFGAIRDAYALPQEDGIQIKDYPTLAKVAGYVQSRLGAATATSSGMAAIAPSSVMPAAASSGSSSARPAPPPMPSPLPPSPPPASVAPPAPVPSASSVHPAPATSTRPATDQDEASILRKVIQLVAGKTGYPADMLEPDLDMEADLGIDTVKQAELIGDVRTTFGIPPVEGMMLKDYPTLRKVAGFVVAQLSVSPAGSPTSTGAAQPQAQQAQSTPQPAPSARPLAAATIPHSERTSAQVRPTILRRVPSLRPQALPDQPNKLVRGTVLVLGDPDNHFVEAFQAAGFQATYSPSEGQAVTGILALALRPGPTAIERVGALFDAAKAHRATLAAGGFVCAVTRQDGAHGLHHVRDPAMAALAGLAKALRKELPGATVKAIDLHPEAPEGAAKVLEELLSGGPRTEVCHGRDGARFVVEVSPQELPPDEPDVEGRGIVVSGGAQGITVEMLAALAPQKPKLLLLGRTEMPEEAPQWAALDAAGWKAMEAAVQAELRAKGDKVTPVAIQKVLDPRRKAADVHRNLARLQDLGATVLYAPVDVTDKATVAEAVAWARAQWGRIDGVLHAAGIEISKDLASKDRAQFESVFNVKVQGWEALMAATRDDRLSFLVAFGSVAGRFGNIGQTDYSAANEYLAKAVKQEAARRKCLTGATIAWGPWGEVGMATKGSILQVMHASGVTPIPTAEGVAHFLAELALPGIRECVVAGQLGAIDADAQVVAKGWDLALEVANRILTDHKERFRLLESIDAIVPDTSLTATVLVDQARDGGLRDHRVDGVPYLPGVFGLEAFAEAASLLSPKDAQFLGAENVRFLLPLKQLKAQSVQASLHAAVVSKPKAEETKVACTLTTQFIGPDGRAHGQPKLHFEGTLRFGRMATDPKAPVPLCERQLNRGVIYPPFFHGPSFQVLEAAGPFAPEAIALFRNPQEPHFGAGSATFTANPMLVEALFQTCGLASLVNDQAMSLPAGISKLEHHAAFVPGDVRLRAKPTGRDAQGNRTFDAEAVASDGSLLVRMSGYAMVETGPAPQSNGNGSIPAGANSPGNSPTGAEAPPLHTSSNGAHSASDTPTATPAMSKAANGPDQIANGGSPRDEVEATPLPEMEDIQFAAVPVRPGAAEADQFTPGEVARHKAFPVDKRRDEWRAGRLAAKQALLHLRPDLLPRDIEVVGDEQGRPRLIVKGVESALWLSITHRDGLAMAAVSPAPVGIDLEVPEDKPQSFLQEAFAVAELRSLLDAQDPKQDTACLWAAKEAALKRAGVGLKADLRKHVVTPDGEGGARVDGPAVNGGYGVRFFMMAGKVLAVSAPACDGPVQETKAE